MSDSSKSFLANLITGLLVAIAVFALGMSREHSVLRGFCDGFFVASVVLLGFGGIKYVRNKGAFDVAGYGLKTALNMNLPWLKSNSPLEHRDEEFLDYRARKEKSRKSAAPELKAGAIYLVLSLILLAIYMAAGE